VDDSLSDLDDLIAVREYVLRSYAEQRGRQWGRTPRPPLGVAEPEVLMELAIRLGGSEGLTSLELRQAVPVGQQRFERGLRRLQEAGIIQRTKERRPDRAGRLRDLVVWRARHG
jgi:hypothetical protein